MPTEYINLLIQVPLVGAFMWFALRLSADYRADAERRDKQWQGFIDRQNVLWRNFIKELSDRASVSDDMMSQRLAELAKVMSSLLEDFKQHDQRTKESNK